MGVCRLAGPEAGHPRSRCWMSWFLWRVVHSPLGLHTTVFSLPTLPSPLGVSVCANVPFKGMSATSDEGPPYCGVTPSSCNSPLLPNTVTL